MKLISGISFGLYADREQIFYFFDYVDVSVWQRLRG